MKLARNIKKGFLRKSFFRKKANQPLAAAATIFRKREVKVTELWKKTDAFMLNTVAKNLEIEKTARNDKPDHILWKSHTVEKLDRLNLPVLNKLEKDTKLRDKFEYVNSAVKSYFRGKDAIVESGMHY